MWRHWPVGTIGRAFDADDAENMRCNAKHNPAVTPLSQLSAIITAVEIPEVLLMNCPVCGATFSPVDENQTLCPVCSLRKALEAIGMDEDKVEAFLLEALRK